MTDTLRPRGEDADEPPRSEANAASTRTSPLGLDDYREIVLEISNRLREHGLTGFLDEDPRSVLRYALRDRDILRTRVEELEKDLAHARKMGEYTEEMSKLVLGDITAQALENKRLTDEVQRLRQLFDIHGKRDVSTPEKQWWWDQVRRAADGAPTVRINRGRVP